MDHHLRIKVVVAESNSSDEPTPRPFVAPPPPVLFRESVFSRPILPATSSLLLPKPPAGPPAPGPERYRECLRNHAASLGAHVVDGCGEFMPWGPAEPLRCAACGCHRSFHRKEQSEPESEPEAPPLQPGAEDKLLLPPPPKSKSSRESSSEEQNGKEKEKQKGKGEKRFRSKFSGEQKGKMAAFAERVGWRLQKKDEADTDTFCRDVGVSRRVLKVWMHNNKHLNIRSKLHQEEEEEHIQQQQYYQPQPADQAFGEEKKTTKKKK